MAKTTKYAQQFKENAVRYRLDHPELTLKKAAENLGISDSALKTWIRAAKEHEGCVPTRGSGNYSSDEAKEIARLQQELRVYKNSHFISQRNDKILYYDCTNYYFEIEQEDGSIAVMPGWVRNPSGNTTIWESGLISEPSRSKS